MGPLYSGGDGCFVSHQQEGNRSMSVIRRLWKEDEGAILSSELVMFATVLVIGMLTGLSAVQTAVVTELADVANAFGSVNQSYSYGGIQGHHAVTPGSAWTDAVDTCDEVCRQVGPASACLYICVNTRHEDAGAGGFSTD